MKGWYSTGWITEHSDRPLSKTTRLQSPKTHRLFSTQPRPAHFGADQTWSGTNPWDTHLRSATFRVITQLLVVNSYRRFGTTDQSHCQGSRNPNRITTTRRIRTQNSTDLISLKSSLVTLNTALRILYFFFVKMVKVKDFSVHAWRRVGEIGL
jgi:hypothetical protein